MSNDIDDLILHPDEPSNCFGKSWGIREERCVKHQCHWCGSVIDWLEVTIELPSGKALDWPHCPVCQGT